MKGKRNKTAASMTSNWKQAKTFSTVVCVSGKCNFKKYNFEKDIFTLNIIISIIITPKISLLYIFTLSDVAK